LTDFLNKFLRIHGGSDVPPSETFLNIFQAVFYSEVADQFGHHGGEVVEEDSQTVIEAQRSMTQAFPQSLDILQGLTGSRREAYALMVRHNLQLVSFYLSPIRDSTYPAEDVSPIWGG
jgi:hypothetical protein